MTSTTLFGWQDVAALAMVLAAAVYLGREFLARSPGKNQGRGCGGGGCHGCPVNPRGSERNGRDEPVTIGIGMIRPTATGSRDQVTSPRR